MATGQNLYITPEKRSKKGGEGMAVAVTIKVNCRRPDLSGVTVATNPVNVSEFNGKKYAWPKTKDIPTTKYNGISLILSEGEYFVVYGKFAISNRHGKYAIVVCKVKEGAEYSDWPIELKNAQVVEKIENSEDSEAKEEIIEKVIDEIAKAGFAISKSKPLTNIAGYLLLKYSNNVKPKDEIKAVLQKLVEKYGKDKVMQVLQEL